MVEDKYRPRSEAAIAPSRVANDGYAEQRIRLPDLPGGDWAAFHRILRPMGERAAEDLEFLDREWNILDGFSHGWRRSWIVEEHLHAHREATVLRPRDAAGRGEVSHNALLAYHECSSG